MTRFARLVAALALTALPGIASAQPVFAGNGQGPQAQDACGGRRQERVLQKFDTNRDGRLEPAERQAMRAGRRQEMLARFDANRDGRLEPNELAAARTERAEKIMARLDTDRDGDITRAEVKGPCSPLARRFARLDRDHDGRLTEAELAAPHRRMKRGRFARPLAGPGAGGEQDVE
jgi:Ca2+-binding EF-hand superfamily protein